MENDFSNDDIDSLDFEEEENNYQLHQDEETKALPLKVIIDTKNEKDSLIYEKPSKSPDYSTMHGFSVILFLILE